ncbi:MAG: class II aldolase/adducin family protein [Candidatus Aenigmarchaeota archaeon]|nr:class II aldolase/adducin family protein [Candidatus Aenigmarchaeota archaeon]
MGDKYEGRKFETVFKGKDLPDDTRIAEVMMWGAKLHKLGLLPAESGGHAGNMSFRNSRGFVITAGGVNKGRLTPRNFVQVLNANLDTKRVEAEGELEPSSETLAHHLIYRERADVNAIVHVHDNLAMKHAEKLKLRSTAKAHPYGTVELANEIAKAAGNQRYLVVRGHGVMAFGKSVWEAGKRVMAVHAEAEQL